jgi:hypothetical protein
LEGNADDVNAAKLIEEGNLLEARKVLFSAGALEMLENGEFPIITAWMQLISV